MGQKLVLAFLFISMTDSLLRVESTVLRTAYILVGDGQLITPETLYSCLRVTTLIVWSLKLWSTSLTPIWLLPEAVVYIINTDLAAT